VLRIPCYAFHNGFSIYNYLLSGVLPTELKPISAESKSVLNRFYGACVGWVRYKPLFLYITRRGDYEREIASMREKLVHTLPKLNACFRTREFTKILRELDRYDRDVETHYAQFMENQQVWRKLTAFLTRRSPAG
jgi:hypothetical protein